MSDAPRSVEIFCAALPDLARAGWRPLEGLAAVLDAAHHSATGPGVAPTLARHMSSIAARLADAAPSCAAIERLDHAGIAFADACVDGEPGALTAFAQRHVGDIEHAIMRARAPEHLREDVRQIVLAKLLPPGRKLARYGGTGTLQNWIRAVTVRETISVLRSTESASVEEDAVAEVAAGGDLELSFIKQTYREQLRVALRATFAALDPEDRAVLRYRFLDGLTLDQLAVVLGVHRATGARWLARLRDDLIRGVRTRLHDDHGIDRADFDGMLALVRSNLEITIGGLLREAPAR